ncbi:MAG: carbamoyl phosphate synthase large subunit, partial [Planctomycetota bacterium]
VFLSVRPSDRKTGVFLGRRLTELGLRVFATPGTYAALQESGVKATLLHKIGQGRPDVLDALKNDELDLIINTPVGKGAHTDEGRIRAAAVQRGVPILTTISGAAAAVNGIAAMRKSTYDVQSLQEYHAAAAAVSK